MACCGKREYTVFHTMVLLCLFLMHKTVKSEEQCELGYFKCIKHDVCIPKQWVCDGIPGDCPDDSDEPVEFCRSWKRFDPERKDEGSAIARQECPPNHYSCPGSTTCIPIAKLCDSVPDCPLGGVDEIPRVCSRFHEPCDISRNKCPKSAFCKPNLGKALCYCDEGFKISDDGKECVDLNECLYENYFCDQRCDNANRTGGSPGYMCECVSGYKLDKNDNKTCVAVNVPRNDPATLLYRTTTGIYQIGMDGTKLAFNITARYGSSALIRMETMDFDHRNNSICWIQKNEQIGRSDTAILNCTRVLSDTRHRWQIFTDQALQNVADMAIDVVTKNFYFTDRVAARILLCNKNGSLCRTLVYLNDETPLLIRLDPPAGYLFLTTTGSQPKILRLSLDGTGRKVLVETAISRPRGFTLDYANRHIYWSDNRHNRIQRINYDGSNRQVVISGSWVDSIYSMSILGNWIYGTDPSKEQIIKFNRHHNLQSNASVIMHKLNQTASIYIYHREKQPINGQQSCGSMSCEHFCVQVPTAKKKTVGKCLCKEGYTVYQETKCKVIDQSVFLIYTSSRTGLVRGIALNQSGSHMTNAGRDVIRPIDGLDGPVSLAYHVQQKMIYYGSAYHGTIGRRSLDGRYRNDSFIVKGIKNCDGLGIDWVAGNIYWTDKALGTITVAKLSDTSIRKVVYNTSSKFHPRDLVVDPIKRALYWTEWSNPDSAAHNGRILTSQLDGSNKRELAASTLNSLYWANGITLSDDRKTLYWVEAFYDRIEALALDTNQPKPTTILSKNVTHPFAVAYKDNVLYWTEMDKILAHDISLKTTRVVMSDSSGLFDVVVYSQQSQPTQTNPCIVCTDLCLIVDGKTSSCQCADGRMPTKKNSDHCIRDPEYSPAPKCSVSEFRCKDGSCIDKSLTCNGVVDCRGSAAEDEDTNTTCANHTCHEPHHMFKCSNNRCVPVRWLCDGEDDCKSGQVEDENPVTCSAQECPAENYTRCNSSKRCIPKSWVCDLDFDCADQSDEPEECQHVSCSPHQFHCNNRRCISQGFVCNQEDDCGDNSDELRCRYICTSEEFKCKNTGKCLKSSFVCDGMDSCGDRSDEAKCEAKPSVQCQPNEFKCTAGGCIPKSWSCDGSADCEDGSDEMTCNSTDAAGRVPCRAERSFACMDVNGRSKCFSPLSRCDKIQDCKNNEDEENCPQDCPYPSYVCDDPKENSSLCLDITRVCDGKPDCKDGKDESFLCGAKVCENNLELTECSHTCYNTPTGYRCGCPSNMTLDADKHTCLVNKPCGWGRCSQRCYQSFSQSVCTCVDGYTLAKDKITCVSNDKRPPYVIFSNRHEIRRFNLGGSNYASLLSALPNTIALDFHHQQSYVFWTDVNEDAIYRGKMEGNSMSNVETIVNKGLSVTEGLAVDWVANNIYWVESQLDQIEVARIDGTYQTTLIAGNMSNPRAIALDPRVGYLFWTDWFTEQPLIERCGMDGLQRTTIFHLNTLRDFSGWPNGMTLDFVAQRVYWIDARSHSIHTTKYDGTDHRLVLKDHNHISHPFAIALYGNNVFWTDWKTNSLYQANKWNGSSVLPIERTITQPFDVHVYHSSRQPQPVSWHNPCADDNGGCSHLCLINTKHQATCRCPLLMKMENETCVDERQFLLYAEPKQIRGVNLTSPYYNVMPAMTKTSLVKQTSSLDYDVSEERFYWSDMEKHTVNRAFINASKTEVVHDANLTNPESLAVDWLTRNLYFTSYDFRTGSIHVSRLDGAFRLTLETSLTLSKPTSIVVYPKRGILYVADTGKKTSKIIRFNLDGSEGNVLTTQPNTVASSLTLDYSNDRLYWVSKVLHQGGGSTIHSSKLDGTNILSIQMTRMVQALCIYKGDLLYAESTLDDLSSVSAIMKAKLDGKDAETLRTTSSPTVALHVYDKITQTVGSPTDCQDNGGCNQLCLLTGAKGKVCRCTAGYRLNQMTCEPISPFLLYSTSSQLFGRELLNTTLVALPPVSNISNISAIDFHPGESYIYWVDSKTTEITRIKRDLTGREVVVKTGPDIVEGLAVDWVADNLYWTNQVSSTIQVSRTNGTFRYVLSIHDLDENVHDLEKPKSIAVHPKKGYLFWTDSGNTKKQAKPVRRARIERSSLNGNKHKVLYNGGEDELPYSLALDLSRDRIYWCNRNLSGHVNASGEIRSMDLSGADQRVERNNSNCFHIAVDDKFVYWSEREMKSGLKYFQIKKSGLVVQKDQTNTLIPKADNRITDLVIFRKADPTVTNACSADAKPLNKCAQLCFFDGKLPICACAYGRLAANGFDCEDHDAFLLFSSINRIEAINMEHLDNKNQPIKPIEDDSKMKNVIGLTFHNPTKTIFFSDINQRNIQQVFYNGTGMKIVANYTGSAEGLAYDDGYNRLYWTSYTNSSIKCLDLDGISSKPRIVVQLKDDDHPRAIVIDSCKSRMYWTNWNSKRPCIQRSYLQGWDVENVITTDIRVPNGLAIDHKAQKLYWSDARLDKIERCDFDGRNRKVIISQIPQHVFALAHYGDYLYWTDWIMHSVVMASKYDGTVVKTLRKTEHQPMGIVAVANDTNHCSLDPCGTNNGNCTHLCEVNERGDKLCKCFDGKVLAADNTTCNDKCDNITDFVCGGQCFPIELTCDGHTHCSDGEDEKSEFCDHRLCPANYHRCRNNRCVRWHLVCDGSDDCGDKSDEESCTCPPGQMYCSPSSIHCFNRSRRCDRHPDCPNGQDEVHCEQQLECPVMSGKNILLIPCNETTACISPSWICDGENDCWDNSDEDRDQCKTTQTCGPGDFQCNDDRRCISLSWKCDRTADCVDSSDEQNCNFTCSADEFECVNSSMCINKMWKCDGHKDCLDGSDEFQCDSASCQKDMFKCTNSSLCILKDQVCDGILDCNDGSDENSVNLKCVCPQKEKQFRCKSGRCILDMFRCDFYHDCENGEDELNCGYANCTKDQWTCSSGQCISASQKCDDYHDCFDLSDESNTTCPKIDVCLYHCTNQTACLNDDQVCDGKKDCHDWSDELRCGINECDTSPCHHNCTNLKLGYVCTCRSSGYALQADGKTCQDVDECVEHDLCSHYCTNTDGGYYCSCMRGFDLEIDRWTCKVNKDPLPYFVFTNRYYIRNMTMLGASSLISSSQINAVAVDYDWSEQRIYWSDVTNDHANISRMFFNKTGKEVLHNTTLKNPDGIAVDWYGRNLYWCDKHHDTIEVSNLDGRFRKVLVKDGLEEPRALVVHPARGYLFYTDWGKLPHIGRIGMDGTERKTLVTKDIGWPNALALDYVRDRIYWGDARLDHIKMADLDGKNLQTIIRTNALPHVFAMTVFAGNVYWTDWEHKSVEQANKLTGRNHTLIRNFIHRPMDIQVVHPSRQLKGEHNPCENNGGCMYLCLIQPGGKNRTCACPENHHLHVDGVGCISNCTSSQFLCKSASKCINFWSKCDGRNDCGDNSDEPADCSPYHCSKSGMFQCLDAKVTHHCIHPQQICDGLIQCQDRSDEFYCMNHTCMPNQYKCELENKCIAETRKCDGKTDCRSGQDEQGCPKPFCEPNHIMCAGSKKCIPYMWRCDGANDCADGSDEPTDCVTRTCNQGFFKCVKSGQCLPDAWKCDGQNDCADGDKTDEPESCKGVTCEPTYFNCDNYRCIPGRWKCDYRDDCGDGSDEKNCNPRNCSESEFRCLSDSRCIAGHWRCNGEDDCDDGSDENNCTNIKCRPDEFTCEASHFCIAKSWRCDGRADCLDNSDEQGCNKTCSASEFRCNNGQCIPKSWKCDGTADCQGDHSDEPQPECAQYECPSDRFSCGDGSCILYSQFCDGVVQCSTKKDETNCNKTKCRDDQFMCTHTHQCVNRTLQCNDVYDCLDHTDEDPKLCKSKHITNCPKCASGRCYNPGFGSASLTAVLLNVAFSDRCVCPTGKFLDKRGDKCHQVETCRQYGTCDQLCVPHYGTPWSYVCHCDTGYRWTTNFLNGTLNNSNRSCKSSRGPEMYVLAVSDTDIYKVNVTTGETQLIHSLGEKLDSLDVQIQPSGALTIFGVNRTANHIVSITLNVMMPRLRKRDATNVKEKILMLKDTSSLRDVAVDWMGSRLYITDSVKSRISVTDLNGGNQITLIDRSLLGVDTIVLNPYKGTRRLFWTVLQPNTRIESAYMDGSDRRILVNDDMILPTDLAIDRPNKRLYWVDVKKKSVETINLDGTDRRVVIAFNITEDAPYKIDVFETDLYITTYSHRRLLKVNKFNPTDKHTVDALKANVHIAVQPVKQRFDNTSCIYKPCGQAACFPLPDFPGYSCLCPDGMTKKKGIVSLEIECTPTPPAHDSPSCTNYHCPNGGTCKINEQNQIKCSCPEQFNGDSCKNDRCLAYCSKNGQCSVIDGEPRCSCQPQYGGPKCNVDKCKSKGHGLCNGHGGCLIDATGEPSCRCDASHTGDRCDKVKSGDFCQGWCLNGGNCSPNSTTHQPSCTCPSGFKGPRCESCPGLDCQHHGRCKQKDGSTEKECDCLRGFTSETLCLHSECDSYCKNNGTCGWTKDAKATCTCTTRRYSGGKCEKDNCDGWCLNGGTCSYYDNGPRCECPSDYRGTKCQERAVLCVDNYCKNNGVCVLGTASGNDEIRNLECKCLHGYAGKHCEIINDCDVLDCQNYAACAIKNGQASCRCTVSWSGPRCTTPSRLKCQNYCYNEGLCHGCFMNGTEIACKECMCHSGWIGDRCQTSDQVQQPENKTTGRAYQAAYIVPLVLVVILVLVAAAFLLYRRRKRLQQFSHMRMDEGASNVEINNPIYRPSRHGDDEAVFMFDGESTTNFSNPLYGSPFGDNAAVPVPNEERKELLDNDQLKVAFSPDDDDKNRSSFA